MGQVKSAYVHIPFCTQICYYCDFSKVFIKNQPVYEYIDSLIAEFDSYNIEELRTLYIGGGTPTALNSQQLEKLLAGLTRNLDLSKLEEFTIEANPGDLDEEKISVLENSPVNRVSLGVQTFDDKLLKKIGRSHTSEDVYHNIELLKNHGFENISIDLIYALPGQTFDQVKEDLKKVLALDLPHVALYSLILENHTIFMNRMRRGKLNLPNEDTDAEMYQYIIDNLELEGYEHYEVSNFSRPGFESKHNLVYWNNEEYYGIGAGASGFIDNIRYKNYGPVHHYLAHQNKVVSEEVLDKKAHMEEEMFLGLRKKSGVNISNFEAKFEEDFEKLFGKEVKKLISQELVEIQNGRIYMTKKGFLLGNEVFESFLLD